MIFTFHSEQTLNASRDEVWKFFSNPWNLSNLIPPALEFSVHNDPPEEITPGMIIIYQLRPFPFMRTTWVTEITHVREREYFVDEQRRGPYSLWHHEHHFVETEEGVKITDVVHYAFVFPPLDRILNKYLVEPKLEEIFRYRKAQIASRFGN